MKPIAQTFLVSQPNTGIDGIFLTKINVYFKSVSSLYGITLEIRTVDNGFPTANRLTGGISRCEASAAVASASATAITTFTFASAPFLQSNVQYAMVLIPDGGNDEYQVWTGELGGVDVNTQAPIYTNNQLGNLFISSNDLVWTPVITESMKYDMYMANFTSSSASVYLKPASTEFIKVNNVVGTFYNTEKIWISNNVITSANTTINLKTVRVPNTALTTFAANCWIYVATSDKSTINFRQVNTAVTNSTAFTVTSNITFTSSNCIVGRIAGNGALSAILSSQSQYYDLDELELIVESPNANTTLNFAAAANQFIFGTQSNASANIALIANRQYDSITPQINFISPAQTAITLSFSGYSNVGAQDASYMTTLAGLPNEFVDKERLLLSRSNALANGTIGSNNTLIVLANLTTSNSMTAPFIDRLGTSVTIAYNEPTAQTQLVGYHLNITNTSGKFRVGEAVTQGAVSGVIDGANNSYVRIISANSTFALNTSIVGAISAASANVTTVKYFDETLENGYYAASRYISKNVVLADKQDAEDLNCYLTAYRPVGTQFNVYGKFLNGSDTDAFSSKDWSVMTEFDETTALYSSAINRDDTVELQFGLPTSVVVDSSAANVTTTTTTVRVADSSFYTVNTYIYIANTTTHFNVRKVSAIVNNSTLTISSNTTFTTANATIGNIPGLQSITGAFLYANNNGILRYTTATDGVYDSYKTFAIKIVPVTNNSILVPIMKNMRCLALQI
jgi:hypothetical protein